MPRYLTKVDRLISHESRTVKAGEFFHTEFPPGPEGKPMRLSETLIEVDEDGNPFETDVDTTAEGGGSGGQAQAGKAASKRAGAGPSMAGEAPCGRSPRGPSSPHAARPTAAIREYR